MSEIDYDKTFSMYTIGMLLFFIKNHNYKSFTMNVIIIEIYKLESEDTSSYVVCPGVPSSVDVLTQFSYICSI